MPPNAIPDLEGIALAYCVEKGYGLSFGPYIIGYGMEMFLMGLILNQMYVYFWDSGRDKLWMRAAVWWTVATSVATTIYIMHWMMFLFVWNFGTYVTFYLADNYSWFVVFDLLTTTVVQVGAGLVTVGIWTKPIPLLTTRCDALQAVYAERAYRINDRSLVLAAAIGLLMLISVGSGISIKVLTKAGDITGGRAMYFLWLAATMSADLLITTAIMLALRRKKTGWEHTDKVINKLTKMSGEVQMPATIVSIVCIIAYCVESTCAIFVFCQMLQPAVHVVGLLTMLNSRGSLRVQLGSFQAHSGFPDENRNSIPLASQSAATGTLVSGSSEVTLDKKQVSNLGTAYFKA